MSRRASGGTGLRVLLLLVSVVLFAVTAFGPDTVSGVSLFALGMATFAASFIFL